jgi:hypothetical protein
MNGVPLGPGHSGPSGSSAIMSHTMSGTGMSRKSPALRCFEGLQLPAVLAGLPAQVQVAGSVGALPEVGLADSEGFPDPQSHRALQPWGDAQAGHDAGPLPALGVGLDGQAAGQRRHDVVGDRHHALVLLLVLLGGHDAGGQLDAGQGVPGDDPLAHALVKGAGDDSADVAPVVVAVAAQGLVQQGLYLGVHLRHVKHAPALEQDNPQRIVRRLLDALPSGSYLAITHLTADFVSPEEAAVAEAAGRDAGVTYAPRSQAGVMEFFPGLDLVDPGVVPLLAWRPDGGAPENPRAASVYAAIGRKP